MRKVLYEPLTPAILDRIEKWVFERMRELGYGCPEVETEGDPNDGQVLIRVRTRASHPQRIVSVTEESIPGIRNGVLRRYDAFRLGDPFNGERLLVTENRVTSSRFVESTSMITDHCTEDEVYLREEVIAGPPRLLTAGFGVNTEGLLLGRASWRNTRLWQMGSLLDVSIFGSARRQTLQTFMNWYFLPEVSRFYLNPQISFDHRNEQQFETLSASTQVGLASSFETSQFGLSAFAGPTLDFYKTLRGAGAPSTRLLSLETRINLKSYPFERWINHPRAGYNLALLTSLNDQGIFSEVSAQRLNFRGEILWNLSNYDPPLWILGIRSALGVVFTPDPSTAATTLPASFFQYLGGSANIRGFGRLELPKTGGGGLTSAYLGAEMRLSNTLPYQVDPFLFVDVGGIGYSPASLDTPVYWSPGIGIRWDSPAGAVRTTLAHGFIGSDPDHVQFFFSLGEEF
jgi:translocation and assembly module TamA